MTSTAPSTGYSAQIRLQLEIAGQVLELAQIGPDDIILSEPATLEPGTGVVVMYVDGRERRWNVQLPDGSRPDVQITRTIRVE